MNFIMDTLLKYKRTRGGGNGGVGGVFSLTKEKTQRYLERYLVIVSYQGLKNRDDLIHE